MPVYERRYRDWTGERRPPRAAVAVVARHALTDIFAARLNLLLFVVACLPFVVFATVIWVAHSVDVLALLQVRDPERLRTGLEGGLFFWFLMWQSSFAFLLASFAGPGLIAPDVAHGALPLYLARPLGRTGYVAGKLAALLTVLSAVTWVPGLLLVVLEGSLSGGDWFLRHARVPAALFVGSWIWILLLSLAALAISAWVRWRPLATGGLFILFVVGSAFGGVINATLDTRWGKLLMAGELVQAIWSWLFGGIVLFGRHWPQDPLPLAVCWLALGVFAALALAVLHRRIRALEVVR